MISTVKKTSPLAWVPTVYFAMGLPFVVLNMVSAVMFKDLGITDSQIAFWTSLIMWPWTIKFLWSPFLEIFRTKKFFVVTTQLLSGVLFGLAALALHMPHFFAVTVGVFAVVAFSGATHDIAADGVYMSELSTEDQARYIGWQGAFYNLAKLVATGGLVWFAGWLSKRFSDSGAATFDAYVQSWTVVLAILCGLLVLLGIYHSRELPSGGSAADGHSLREGLRSLKEVIAAFFTKKHIWYYIAFIVFYRLGEGFVMKIVPLFLKADTAAGGLGLTNQQIGLYYGTFGAGAFLLGSLLAGYYIAHRGLRRSLFTLCCIFNLPFAVYALLAIFVGFIVMASELAMGRKTGQGAMGTYHALTKKFRWIGWLALFSPFAVMGFYAVLGGYCIEYMALNLSNFAFGSESLATGGELFAAMLSNPAGAVLFAALFLALCYLINRSGISGGIEKFNNMGMPTLFVMLVVIIIRSLTLPGAMEGLKFMFVPGYAVEAGFVAETPSLLSVFASAGGQMFFSLSLAMGAMITYGSYLNQKEDLVKNSAIIVFADTLVATMAGIAVIPAAVANGIASGTPLDQIKLGGPNLLFVTLQDVFRAMGTVGALFGVIFYLLVLIAAISSAIALIEVDITYFLDRAEQKGRKGNRPKVAFLVCLAIFAVSVLVGIDGLGTTGVFPWPATAGWNDSMLDFVDMLSEGLAMPIGALMMSIMVGWEIRPQTVLDELHIGYTGRIDTFYRICIKYITPIGMLLVLAGQVNEFFSLNWF